MMKPDPSVAWPPINAARPLAVLVSGGLDSAVLLAEAARSYATVHPLYVRSGLAWETVELEHLQRFIRALHATALRSLDVLQVPVADLYGKHWSIDGRGVPDENSADAAVYLPGRNVLLLSKALVWSHLNRMPELALAILKGNPFPDATPEFFAELTAAVNRAVEGNVAVLRPYAHLSKAEVIRRGRALPLGETFSCIRPIDGGHCGRCNKCAERRSAFAAAGVPDPTTYAS
jgi:7-cyano-7-deazaguanine synthase